MFRVNVRQHMMIAHSFNGEVFGPAQAMHGATYVVDLELRASALDENGIVADIGRLTEVLAEILAELNYKNLDELPQFSGQNTTTEVLAQWVHNRAAAAIRDGLLGTDHQRLLGMQVTLNESHIASAAYEAPL